jgi:ABC-2 type transport system ATP-binding protein
MHDSTLSVRARGLSRSYKKTIKAEGLAGSLKSLFKRETLIVDALGGFDLDLRPGEMLGVIGPNGAGKTTLVKLLSGIMRPDSGRLEVLGHSPRERKAAFLSRIALVMGQRSQLWWDLPAVDSLLLNKAIYGLSENRYRASLARLASSLEIEGLLDSPVRALSLGERMRVEFAAAMLHEPELVFLDEPTLGLDAPAQRRIREFLVRENRERGMTLILTSHYMEDIRSVCPRSIMILKGRKAFDGPTDELFGDAPREASLSEAVERLYEGKL